MKKFLAALSLVIFSTLSIPFAANAEFKPEYKMSVNIAEITPPGKAADWFVKEVKRRTDGKINIKIYWNGQLMSGKATNELLLMRKNVGDFSISSFINWAPQFPAGNLFLLPWFITGKTDRYRALDAVEEGSAGKMLESKVDKMNLKILSWGEAGLRELTNSKRPITSPADMKDLKIRVIGSPLFIDIFKALGANPMNISWAETLTSLQQNTVDGQENPYSIYIPNRVYEFQKYLTEWGYNVDPLIYVVHKDVWNTFPKDVQKIIAECAVKACRYNKALARIGLDDGTSAKWLKANNLYPANNDISATDRRAFAESKGVKISRLTPAQIKVFADIVKPVRDKWIPKVGKDLVDAANKDMSKIN